MMNMLFEHLRAGRKIETGRLIGVESNFNLTTEISTTPKIKKA